MDQMLPSPGFSIPSIGTPLHQPEEDQQILPAAAASPMHSANRQPGGFGLTLPHQQQQASSTPSSSQPLYSMPGFTPQHMLQPQTPVNPSILRSFRHPVTLSPVSAWSSQSFLLPQRYPHRNSEFPFLISSSSFKQKRPIIK